MVRPEGAPADWRDEWAYVGRTRNTACYAHDRVLIAWPDEGTHDDEEVALENARFEMAYFERLRRPGVLVVYIDRIAHQDRAARKVYQQVGQPELLLGIALVGGSMLSRAIASFFVGLSRPRMPARLFASYTDAEPWLAELLAGSR